MASYDVSVLAALSGWGANKWGSNAWGSTALRSSLAPKTPYAKALSASITLGAHSDVAQVFNLDVSDGVTLGASSVSEIVVPIELTLTEIISLDVFIDAARSTAVGARSAVTLGSSVSAMIVGGWDPVDTDGGGAWTAVPTLPGTTWGDVDTGGDEGWTPVET